MKTLHICKIAMDQVIHLVMEYRGSSLTSTCMRQLKYTLDYRFLNEFEIEGDYLFRVQHECVCQMACGGIFCDSLKIYRMVGVAESDVFRLY